MISPVSSGAAVSAAVHSAPQPKPQQAAQPQDTVDLSSKAKDQASGDVDHDGDSH